VWNGSCGPRWRFLTQPWALVDVAAAGESAALGLAQPAIGRMLANSKQNARRETDLIVCVLR
ncbi:hypothetical protein, partial [Xanthomonas graminis]|uniref:hypothetical protein n=1 Tax=Xanthomonas graminis TaxID=3390026 RepID=UPI001C2FB60E